MCKSDAGISFEFNLFIKVIHCLSRGPLSVAILSTSLVLFSWTLEPSRLHHAVVTVPLPATQHSLLYVFSDGRESAPTTD